jgi:uncharacterized protein with NAD-binding domain and iron-sulfur cluster
MAGNKVIVMGGGVAGLSAAHELAERGFNVEVYEKRALFGGKARSTAKPNSAAPGRLNLPGEHGFRVFPGFYQHLPDTMRRIPFQGNAGGVLDNLVAAPQTAVAQEMRQLFTFSTHLPHTPADWGLVLEDWFGRSELGLATRDTEHFVSQLLKFMSTCTRRRFAELEYTKWWNYIGAPSRSFQYRKLLARGITRSLVAMRAEDANTRTVGALLIQMMMSLTSQSATMDRILNAPTSEAWIDPWLTFLTAHGVHLFSHTTIEGFNFNGSEITAVLAQTPNGQIQITGDYYLAAFPVEVAQQLFAPAMRAVAPEIERIRHLATEWMNGIQFYLRRDVRICNGHVILADSPWALTCISQPQFWSGTNMAGFGAGNVRGLISVDISDWATPGSKVTTKPARQCTEQEIAMEVWAQLVDHLASAPGPLQPSDMIGWYLDPSITFPVVKNDEPLLVNTVGSWANRPSAATAIPNLFLASDYVRTNTDLATMEGANEAARRAVNEIITVSGVNAPPCGVWEFKEPIAFDRLKKVDEVLFNAGLPNPGFAALKVLETTASLLGL